ncbi:NUDIX hydrolase [Segetibacter koreensis]|uniref:NUDIX hydrolase n=1 Tax=Segetibacter koreensis TaxID=398037 RepID=UPI00037F9756|nr:NUDIX domain-containing protein [Segetibacter koreensis]
MNKYKGQHHFLLAVDCIIFGFDGKDLKLLLIQRGFEPEKNKWSLMGGFLEENEDLDQAANRILKKLTGLEDIYLEQLHAFGKIDRDPGERTVSVSYFALIDIERYKKQITPEYSAEWFLINERPKLIFDHDEMVTLAQNQLRYRAAIQPLLFELLPEQFTIPQLQNLYEGVYETVFDKRNFIRKLMSTGLLIKLAAKDKSSSRKGAFLYKLDKKQFNAKLHIFLNYINDMSQATTGEVKDSNASLLEV